MIKEYETPTQKIRITLSEVKALQTNILGITVYLNGHAVILICPNKECVDKLYKEISQDWDEATGHVEITDN